jgi:AraC-like DNA-binding protein
MAYLRALRLNVVRHELRAVAATASVRAIAQRWGFWHTGEFAAAYRRLFGELPSQTRNGRPRGMRAGPTSRGPQTAVNRTSSGVRSRLSLRMAANSGRGTSWTTPC